MLWTGIRRLLTRYLQLDSLWRSNLSVPHPGRMAYGRVGDPTHVTMTRRLHECSILPGGDPQIRDRSKASRTSVPRFAKPRFGPHEASQMDPQSWETTSLLVRRTMPVAYPVIAVMAKLNPASSAMLRWFVSTASHKRHPEQVPHSDAGRRTRTAYLEAWVVLYAGPRHQNIPWWRACSGRRP